MRIPVVDTRGVPLMPCTPAKARHLFKSGKAKPKRNKLGVFYVQLAYEQKPDNQPLVVGVDPGSKFEGYSVVGTNDTVLNLMAEAPDHVKDAVETRRTMRRARRYRKWRRPKRFDNRLGGKKRIPPSTRARWEAKARIIAQLLKILPLDSVVVEDVCAELRKGKGRKWNGSFSPVQVGKEHLYKLLAKMGLTLHLCRGHQTKELREKYGLKKTKSKSKQDFSSHAVDGWVMAASVSGAEQPTCRRLWYLVGAQLHRRQIHRLQASKGGERKPYGTTRSLGLKRGTVVRHPKYGLCTVGGFDRKKQTISLHAYRTNKRLTQGGRVKDCRILTWVAFRSWLVAKEEPKKKGKGSHPSQSAKKGRPIPPLEKSQGLGRQDDVVPDLVWISQEQLEIALQEDGRLHSSPELVIEVLSPGLENERRDREVKLKLYSRRGAQEYWIVDWRQQRLEVYRRREGVLTLDRTLGVEDTLTSPLLPGFRCQISQIFTCGPKKGRTASISD